MRKSGIVQTIGLPVEPAQRPGRRPNLEAGDRLARELAFVAPAGLVLGARAPVMLTSRADNDRARLATCALAKLYEYYRHEGRAFGGAPTVVRSAE